jgi:hypothetical protein
MADVQQGVPVLGCEQPSDAEVAGVVDRRLGSQGAAFLEVLLDLAVLVVRLDLRIDAALDDGVWKRPGVRRETLRPKTMLTWSGRPSVS